MEQNEKLAAGTQKLLFRIQGSESEYDYSSLMSTLISQPELLLHAEKITWLLPLGFIVKQSSNNSEITDYLILVEDKVDLTKIESILYYSSRHDVEYPIIDILHLDRAFPVYEKFAHLTLSELFHPETEEDDQEDDEYIQMCACASDVMLYIPSVCEGPIVLTKGSSIPAALVSKAEVEMIGTGNLNADLEAFYEKVKLHKQNKSKDEKKPGCTC